MMGLTPKQLAMISVLIVGTFVTVLNQTLLTPALPCIMAEMEVSAATAQWLITGFTLVNAIMIPITAFLIDKYPTRTIFITSMAVFAFGSLLAGIGLNFPMFLGGRLLQAAGAGVLMPLVQVVLILTFPPERRGSAMGMFGLVIAFAPAVGPSVAGLVIDHMSYHVLFYGITVLALVVLGAGLVAVQKVAPRSPDAALDVPSVALSTAGFALLLYGFSDIGSNGVGVLNVLLTAVGVVVTALFFARQLRMEKPMLNVRVLANKRFLVGTVVGMLVQMTLLAAGVLMPIYLQTYMFYSATASGLLILPGAILMGVMGLVVGPLFDKRGPRALAVFGLGLLTVTTALFSFLDRETGLVYLTVVYTLRMFAMSLVNMPITTWALNALDDRLVSHGSSVNNTLRQVAGSLGTALLVSVSTSTMSHAQSVGVGFVDSGIMGIEMAFTVATGLCAVGFVLAVALVKDKKTKEEAVASDPDNARRLAVEAVMRRDVYTIPATATVFEAVRELVERGISAAPVVDGEGRPVGFVSDGDVTRYLARKNQTYTDPVLLIMLNGSSDEDFGNKLGELMDLNVMSIATPRVIDVDIHTSLPDVCRILGQNHLKKIPVTDDGQLVGVINRSDIARYSMSRYLQTRDEK